MLSHVNSRNKALNVEFGLGDLRLLVVLALGGGNGVRVSSLLRKGSWLGYKGTGHSVHGGDVRRGSTGQSSNLGITRFAGSSLSAGDLPAVDHLDNLLHLGIRGNELNFGGGASSCILSEDLVLWTDLTGDVVYISDNALCEELLDESISFTLGIDAK